MKPALLTDNFNQDLTEVIIFATNAHHNHYKKGTGIPYIFHPINVGRILIEHGCPGDVVKAGILHDILEDTKTDSKEIEKFGGKVLKYVRAVTEPDKNEKWQFRKELQIINAQTASLRVLQIICADKLDNITQIANDLEKEGEKVWGRFNALKAHQEWYYKTLLEIFQERFTRKEDLEMAGKLKEKMDEVFKEGEKNSDHYKKSLKNINNEQHKNIGYLKVVLHKRKAVFKGFISLKEVSRTKR